MEIHLANNKEYAWLLNSSSHYVTYRPVRSETKWHYTTAEHLFQSLKFEVHRPRIAKLIRSERKYKLDETVAKYEEDIRPDWSIVRIAMMKITLYRKFRVHTKLRNKLKSTGNRQLINNTSDVFWGIGSDFSGENQFGKALMEVRQDAIRNDNLEAPPLPQLPEPVIFFDCKCDCHLHGFSTFSNYSIKFLDVVYPTAGHLFQAFRFSRHQSIVNRILGSTTAQEVGDIARGKKHSCRSDWKDIRIPAMRYIVWLKFTQHPILLLKLHWVKDRPLQVKEDSTEDGLWAWGDNVDGKDQLVKAIMRLVRVGLQEPPLPPNPPRKFEEPKPVDGCCIVM